MPVLHCHSFFALLLLIIGIQINIGEKKYLGFPEQGFVIESFGADSNNLPMKEMNNPTEFSPLIQQVIIDSEKDLNDYYYPNGPILGLGIDIYGTLIVQIYKDGDVSLR